MLGLLRTHPLVFRERRAAGGGVTSFAFQAQRPLPAKAGQHAILAIGATAMKPFSLASAPEEDLVLIGTSLASGSAFKKRMATLRPGDTVTLRGPLNAFTLDGAHTRVVLLAQGVGITPMRSMLAHAALTGRAIDSTLIHVARTGHAYRQETEQWASSAAYPQHTEDFRAHALAAARAQQNTTFYVAGATAFVAATVGLLRSAGVPGRDIRQDKYLFYKPQPAPTGAHFPQLDFRPEGEPR
jgi:ferredoxin-NADP reductase